MGNDSKREQVTRGKGRRGGRTAKLRRDAAERGHSAAVRPGLVGGAYKPLTDADIERIYDTALDILETIGIGDPIPEINNYALPKGAFLSEHNRLCFPRALVEDLLSRVPKNHHVHAVDSKYDFRITDSEVFFSTSGEAVTILDYDTQSYRPTRLTDLYDAARLAHQLEHIHNFGQPFIAAELSEDAYVHDINVAYAALAGTSKAFSLSTATVQHVDVLIAMFDTFLGREGAFVEKPFCSIGGCPIVSPLRFGKDNAEVMVRLAELGLVADVAVAPQAGATSPAALAGSLAQCFAETLACLCVVNLVRPGAPINFGMWPFISDLRTGAFTGGSGEEAVIMAATAQLCNHFGLLSSTGTGMTDAKTMDVQAGYEKALTVATAALAGCNHVAAYPGVVGSLLGQSFEGMIIDNDMIGNVQRILRGIEVNDETLSFDVIKDVVFGTGHYLGHEQTLRLMKTEYLYPELADRQTVGAWEEDGHKTMYEKAHERVQVMLADYYPQRIDPAIDARIRERFPIRLNPEDMRAGNARW